MSDVTPSLFSAPAGFGLITNQLAATPLISHEYTYMFTDIRNNAILGELPLQDVTYSRNLSTVGEMSGSLSINSDTLQYDPKFLTEPGAKRGIYVLRDGVPVWGGIIWKRKYSGKDRKLSITCSTFESYFYLRFQRITRYWSDTDQLSIARWLVQSNGSAAAILTSVSSATSPRKRERTMFGYEFKTSGEELEALSNLIDGFDWNVEIYLDADGTPQRRLEFYYPYAGISREKTTLFFESPGSVSSFEIDEDGQGSATSMWAIGGGEGSEQLQANAQDSAQVGAGWPLIEQSRSYKSVFSPITLQGHADADRDRMRTPMTVFTVDVIADRYPQFGTYRLGDWARFKLQDEYVNPAFDAYARITGISVQVEGATGVENVNLTLGGNEVRTETDDEIV